MKILAKLTANCLPMLRSKISLSVIFSFIFLFLPFREILAIEPCDTTRTFQQDYEEANVVIRGEVVEIATNWVSSGLKITFKIDESWIRTIERYTTVNTGTLDQGGYSFQKGSEYLVFVNKKFNMKVNQCSRVGLVEDMGEELAQLGPGLKPSGSPGAFGLQVALVVLSFGSLAFVAFVVLRKRIGATNPDGKRVGK